LRRDVGRPDRIAAAALAVISEKGLSGLTHRAVAAAAGVPLGSTTYHFKTLHDIVEAAFDAAMAQNTSYQEAWWEALPSGTDLPVALTDLLFDLAENAVDEVYVNYELSLAAVRRPQLHGKANRWYNHLIDLLAVDLTREVAVAVAAVYDGLLLRQVTTGSLPPRDEIESSFRRVCGRNAKKSGRGRL